MEKSLLAMVRTTTLRLVLSPSHFQTELFQIVFLTGSRQVGDRIDCFREERQVRRCFVKTSDICVVVGRIQMSGHPDMGSFSRVGASFHFDLGVLRTKVVWQ